MKVKKYQLKNRPCRLGTTSYIIPADILPNLRFLADRVEDVELVLFESDEYSNLPLPADVAEMAKIAESSDLTYTVHLPLDAWPGSIDERLRKNSMEKWFRVMDLMAPLNPFAWIVHLNDAPLNDANALAAWQDQCRKSVNDLTLRADPFRLSIETLRYDYNWVWPIVDEKNCSVCLDIGHLVLNGYDVRACCDTWLKRTRVMHIHGVAPSGRDHVDLSHLDSDLIAYLLMELKNETHVSRVMTLEIFSREDLEKSMDVLERICNEK